MFSVFANSLGDSYGNEAGELLVQGSLAPKHALTDAICGSSSRFSAVLLGAAWQTAARTWPLVGFTFI